MNTCYACGSSDLEEVLLPEAERLGGVLFRGEMPWERCKACGEATVYAQDGFSWDRAVSEAAILHGLSSGPLVRRLRKGLGLSGKALADLVRTTPETVSHWETGKHPIPFAAWALLAIAWQEAQQGGNSIRSALLGLPAKVTETRDISISIPPRLRRGAVLGGFRDLPPDGPDLFPRWLTSMRPSKPGADLAHDLGGHLLLLAAQGRG